MLPLTSGCPGTTTPDGSNGGDGDNNAGAPKATSLEIVSFRNNFEISELEPPVSVLYTAIIEPETAESDIRGFYVEVPDASPDAAAIGDPVVVATDLPAGTNRAFNFDPSLTGVGFYRVGIVVTLDQEQTEETSQGVIQVQGPPNPSFVRPTDAITEVSPGAEVIVSFDAGDPEGVVQWRAFVLAPDDSRTASPEDLGTQLRVGSGNVGSFNFSTAGLAEGDYELGVSATDSGLSISSTVANGDLDRIVTIPRVGATPMENVSGPIIRVSELRTDQPPLLEFTTPGADDINSFGDSVINLAFEVTIREPGASGLLELFYDNNNNVDDGNTPLATDLSDSVTSFQLDTADLPGDGLYYIGGVVRDGINAPVVEYADGRINLVRTGTLEITEPNDIMSLKPTANPTEDDMVTISWVTNVPEGEATIDVVAKPVGTGSSAEFKLLEDAEMSVTSVDMTAESVDNESGLYEIFVTVTFNSGSSLSPLTASAAGLVRVSSLPAVLWVEDLESSDPPFDGAIFKGVQPEDNAGSDFTKLGGNIPGFNSGAFVIASRYGKPFFVNPSGIGVGEAYLIAQDANAGAGRFEGSFSLNAVGTTMLPGITFAGVRVPEGDDSTDGLANVSSIPDVDGDQFDELIFGFSFTDSRGHNASPDQDGVIDPRALSTLEREQQFQRGGIVIVSSQSLGGAADTSACSISFGGGSNEFFLEQQTTIPLDLVGQNFESLCVEQLPGDDGVWTDNVHGDFNEEDEDASCQGTCADRTGGGSPDANSVLDYGFVSALARDYFSAYVYNAALFGGKYSTECQGVMDFVDRECVIANALEYNEFIAMEYCAPLVTGCDPQSPGLHGSIEQELVSVNGNETDINNYPNFDLPEQSYRSGFYNSDACWPFGARIIGVGMGDEFGSSMAIVGDDMIISSPARTARGLQIGSAGGPELGGEIKGLQTDTRIDAGVAYLFPMRNLWDEAENEIGVAVVPPKPHQYIVGEPSHCPSDSPQFERIDNIEATRIAGNSDDAIENIVGLDDFNEDGRPDFAVGAPNAEDGRGRVYVAYRRAAALEDDFVLEKLALDTNDSERLQGSLFVANGIDQFGFSLASDVDFNRDGRQDLVIGSPGADAGTGEIIIVFGDADLSTSANGLTVEELIALRKDDGSPYAVRITGSKFEPSGQFGFNVAAAGDVDGDGRTDLLVAAPFSSPRYDPDTRDAVDELSEIGVDTNLDGVPDNAEDVTGAGVVYVITGESLVTLVPPDAQTGAFELSIDDIGGAFLKGFLIAGSSAGDQLGGGDAGDPVEGLAAKQGRGRSRGLGTAGDVDGDGRDEILVGAILADPGNKRNAGEAYLIYGGQNP
jgi:hypothetical protein